MGSRNNVIEAESGTQSRTDYVHHTNALYRNRLAGDARDRKKN